MQVLSSVAVVLSVSCYDLILLVGGQFFGAKMACPAQECLLLRSAPLLLTEVLSKFGLGLQCAADLSKLPRASRIYHTKAACAAGLTGAKYSWAGIYAGASLQREVPAYRWQQIHSADVSHHLMQS